MKSTNSTVGMGKIPPQCGGNVTKATKGDGSRGSAPAVKKALSLFLSLAMLFSITAGLDFSAYANTYSGKCGKNATWTLNAATKTLTTSDTGTMYDSELKAKKKYYVRIRTYKTVKVNGKNTKIYSGWSKAKTVKTK